MDQSLINQGKLAYKEKIIAVIILYISSRE